MDVRRKFLAALSFACVLSFAFYVGNRQGTEWTQRANEAGEMRKPAGLTSGVPSQLRLPNVSPPELSSEEERARATEFKRLRIIERARKNNERARSVRQSFSSNGTTYSFLSGYGVTTDKSRVPNEVEWIQTKGGYWLYKTNAATIPIASNETDDNGQPQLAVVFNEITGRVGIFTGNYTITPRKMADLGMILQDHAMELVQRFDHLGFVSVRSKLLESPVEKRDKLLRDSRVQAVELDILENELKNMRIKKT